MATTTINDWKKSVLNVIEKSKKIGLIVEINDNDVLIKTELDGFFYLTLKEQPNTFIQLSHYNGIAKILQLPELKPTYHV